MNRPLVQDPRSPPPAQPPPGPAYRQILAVGRRASSSARWGYGYESGAFYTDGTAVPALWKTMRCKWESDGSVRLRNRRTYID